MKNLQKKYKFTTKTLKKNASLFTVHYSELLFISWPEHDIEQSPLPHKINKTPYWFDPILCIAFNINIDIFIEVLGCTSAKGNT